MCTTLKHSLPPHSLRWCTSDLICMCIASFPVTNLQLTFMEDLKITEMFSSDGEKVPFSEELYPTGNVEDWLLEVERVMRASLNDILRRALEAYPEVSRHCI